MFRHNSSDQSRCIQTAEDTLAVCHLSCDGVRMDRRDELDTAVHTVAAGKGERVRNRLPNAVGFCLPKVRARYLAGFNDRRINR